MNAEEIFDIISSWELQEEMLARLALPTQDLRTHSFFPTIPYDLPVLSQSVLHSEIISGLDVLVDDIAFPASPHIVSIDDFN